VTIRGIRIVRGGDEAPACSSQHFERRKIRRNFLFLSLRLERATGFEPATSSLGNPTKILPKSPDESFPIRVYKAIKQVASMVVRLRKLTRIRV
jgi:hypothetical protein